MKHLVDSVRSALDQNNLYAALGMALTLPDICGRMTNPTEKSSQRRFVDWCEVYLTPKYTRYMGDQGTAHVLLGARDTYALRCAVLHEGSADIQDQRAREAIASFMFITISDGDLVLHLAGSGSVLELQVDVFCNDVCDAVDDWLATVMNNDADITNRINGLMRIHVVNPGDTVVAGGDVRVVL